MLLLIRSHCKIAARSDTVDTDEVGQGGKGEPGGLGTDHDAFEKDHEADRFDGAIEGTFAPAIDRLGTVDEATEDEVHTQLGVERLGHRNLIVGDDEACQGDEATEEEAEEGSETGLGLEGFTDLVDHTHGFWGLGLGRLAGSLRGWGRGGGRHDTEAGARLGTLLGSGVHGWTTFQGVENEPIFDGIWDSFLRPWGVSRWYAPT